MKKNKINIPIMIYNKFDSLFETGSVLDSVLACGLGFGLDCWVS